MIENTSDHYSATGPAVPHPLYRVVHTGVGGGGTRTYERTFVDAHVVLSLGVKVNINKRRFSVVYTIITTEII